MASTTVTVLGAGDAFASRGLFQAGYLIEALGHTVLLEAGPAVLASMKRSQADPAAIDTILISHLHGDHFAGLAFLILEYLYETRRRRILTIAGPRRLESRARNLFRALYRETDASPIWRKLRFVALQPETSIRLGPLAVKTIRTPHMRTDISLGFRLSIAGKSIAFSGDTGWTDDLLGLSAGVDLFLCECTYYRAGSHGLHLNYLDLAAKRSRFSARRMILTHLGREVLEHRSEMDFETAADGMKIEL